MHEWTGQLAGDFVTAEQELGREYAARLVECAPLAFRVAFSVLRHREDAEDVAQEAFTKAHRKFRQLRDPERFKSWLVRTVWRTALDRRRGDLANGSKVSGLSATRTFRTTNALVLRDGQSTEFTTAVDKVNGEIIKASVTVAVVKQQAASAGSKGSVGSEGSEGSGSRGSHVGRKHWTIVVM